LQQSGRALNPDERTSAIRALVDVQGPKALPLLIEASKDKQPSVRGAAATGLGHVPTQEALAALTRLLNDPLQPVRIAAAVSLGRLHGLDTIPPLRKAMEDQDASVRAFVIGALLAQGERYRLLADPISTLSNAKEPAVRTAVARVLGNASSTDREPARSAVLTLAQDSVPRVRIAAIKSMAKLEGMNALVFLKRGLHDEDDAVRTAAGGSLLHIVPLNR
jgi:HEAT repeat protein